MGVVRAKITVSHIYIYTSTLGINEWGRSMEFHCFIDMENHHSKLRDHQHHALLAAMGVPKVEHGIIEKLCRAAWGDGWCLQGCFWTMMLVCCPALKHQAQPSSVPRAAASLKLIERSSRAIFTILAIHCKLHIDSCSRCSF